MAFTEDEVENGRALPTAIVYAPTGLLDPVASAVAFLTREGRLAFAETAGDVAVGITKQEALLVKATRYVERLARYNLMGFPASPYQSLLMPRINLIVAGWRLYQPNEIAEGYLQAIWWAAEWAAAGVSLDSVVVTNVNRIKRKKTDVLETEYFEGGSQIPDIPVVYDLLEPFYAPAGQMVRA